MVWNGDIACLSSCVGGCIYRAKRQLQLTPRFPKRVGCLTVILPSTVLSEGEWGVYLAPLLLTAIYTRVSCVMLSFLGWSWVTRGARAGALGGEVGLVVGGLGRSGLDLISIGPKLFYPVHNPPSTRLWGGVVLISLYCWVNSIFQARLCMTFLIWNNRIELEGLIFPPS
jgi:hypothetical protein